DEGARRPIGKCIATLLADAKARRRRDSWSLAPPALALHGDHSSVRREQRTRELQEIVEADRARHDDACVARERSADGLRTLLAHMHPLEGNLSDRIAEEAGATPSGLDEHELEVRSHAAQNDSRETLPAPDVDDGALRRQGPTPAREAAVCCSATRIGSRSPVRRRRRFQVARVALKRRMRASASSSIAR